MKRAIYKGDPYHGNWDNVVEMCADFSINPIELKGAKVLYASYNQGYYDGSAYVLFKRDGKLYDVNGSHCSCFGLENQWDPEETSVEAIYKYNPSVAEMVFGPVKSSHSAKASG
jgi:hypothetical protein